MTIDADIAYARARFTEDDAGDPDLGDCIPGAVEGVATLGAIIDNIGPWFGGLQLRYFGPRPLTEENDQRSSSTTLLSGRVGYKINKGLRVQLEGFNLLDREDSQIDYFYTSRLDGEPARAWMIFTSIRSSLFRFGLAPSSNFNGRRINP